MGADEGLLSGDGAATRIKDNSHLGPGAAKQGGIRRQGLADIGAHELGLPAVLRHLQSPPAWPIESAPTTSAPW